MFYFLGWNEDPQSGGGFPVAVKQIKDSAPDDEKLEFLEEAELMAQLSHPHVVRMVGVVTRGERPCAHGTSSARIRAAHLASFVGLFRPCPMPYASLLV